MPFVLPAHTPFYALFYATAFVLGVLLVFADGRRRGWPAAPWLGVLAACLVGAVAGSKLLLVSAEAWRVFFSEGAWPHTAQKTYLGGVLGGVAGVAIARRWLGFRAPAVDAFAGALPVALAVGRIGCLLAGCCFGTPTALPWGVAYETGSAAHAAHVGAGLVVPGAASLPVHPVAAYEVLFCLVLLLALPQLRRWWRAPGNLFYGTVALYGVFRFFEEAVRPGATTFAGLKTVQWGLLAVVLLLGLLVFVRERRCILPAASTPVLTGRLLLLLTVLAGAALLGRTWFTLLERLVLLLILVPLSGAALLHLAEQMRLVRVRWSMLSLLIAAPLVVSMQVLPEDTVAPDTTVTTTTLSLGGQAGKYAESCGGVHRYGVAGVGLNRTWMHLPTYNRFTLGLRGYVGVDREVGPDPDGAFEPDEFTLWAANPYAQVDTRWAGFTIGAHLGRLYFDGDSDVGSALGGGRILPAFGLRLGPYDAVYAEANLAHASPASLPAPIIQLGIGYQHPSGTLVRAGFSDAGIYVNPRFSLNDRLMLDPAVAFGDADAFQLRLSLHYRFGH